MIIRARTAPRAEVDPEFRSAPPDRAYLDADLLDETLLVRAPCPGDRFRPLGSPGARKLSDIFVDLKIPRDARPRSLLVESGGEIAWAVGLRIANRFRITSRTRNVAILEALPYPDHRTGEKNEGHTQGERRILYTADEIAAVVEALAHEVSEWAAGRELTILGILQGSFVFLADLARHLEGPVRIGFVDRRGNPVAGSLALEGQHVLLVEDILDTGESLSSVLAKIRASGPAEVRTCILFDKPSGRKMAIDADFRGLTVPDRWVVGYGLDLDGRHRNLPYLTWF